MGGSNSRPLQSTDTIPPQWKNNHGEQTNADAAGYIPKQWNTGAEITISSTTTIWNIKSNTKSGS